MRQPRTTPNDLIACWQRYDWRQSMFAPGVVILQALTQEGFTASGLGSHRETAFARCLGETAELHALAAAGGAGGLGHCALRDGLAAHPESRRAREAAVLEAFERQVIGDWWQGRRQARPLLPGWLIEAGIEARIAAARHEADQRRPTGFWQVDSGGGPVVVIARSTNLAGQEPMLGYGCDPDAGRAARKALRELLLMEVNLMELLATRATHPGPDPMDKRIEDFARRCPALLPLQGAVRPQGPGALMHEDAQVWFGVPVELREITPPTGPVAVWHCRPALPVPDFAGDAGSPFV